MDEKTFKTLRAPFPKEQISQLPKAGVKLDYVSHSATTNRLLDADHSFTWEPMARDEAGAPILVRDKDAFSDPMAKVGIWIWLDVAGVRTPGFGEGKNVKEAIGDAIRNAAMRRGVALDLWAKEDLSSEGEPRPQRGSGQASRQAAPSPSVTPDTAELEGLLKQMGKSEDEIKLIFDHHKGLSGGQIKPEWVKAQTAKAKKHLETLAKAKAA
jgi:hypothetical protein